MVTITLSWEDWRRVIDVLREKGPVHARPR